MSANQKITILNSRQGLYPCRLHLWIQKTLEALQSLQKSNVTVVSSIGMSTWELVTAATSQFKIPLELHVQIKKNESEELVQNKILSEFNLNPKSVRFVYIYESDNTVFQKSRDISITNSADILFPISIREKGNLTELLKNHTNKINLNYKTQFKKTQNSIKYIVENKNLTHDLQSVDNKYLIHWTKTAKNKWSHENKFDYYSAILQSDIYPRDAFHTLQNICSTKTIKASHRHMPQNILTVSFTALTPIEMIPFFTWRKRYNEMSFEPYGIGIKKTTAHNLGIQQVVYYDKTAHMSSRDETTPQWLTQSQGIITNWESEQEYRHLGEFNFHKVDKNDMILFTRYKKEADQLQKLTGLQTISFQN